MLDVVRDLLGTTAVRLVDGLPHRVGDLVGVHVDLAGHVARRPADRLDQTACRTKEAFLVGVQDRHERHLGQVKTLAEQVDPDKHVVLPQPQLPQQFDAAQRVHLGVQVPHPDAHLQQVIGQVLGHLLGQRGHQHAFVGRGALADLADQVVDLTLGRFDHDLRIHQSGGANDLFDELAAGLAHLVGSRGGREINGLPDPVGELFPGQRSVVDRRGKPETEVHQVPFARHVALVHSADLRHRDVGLVDDHQEVFGEVVDQGRRSGAWTAPVDVPRVVLDARTEPDLAHHLDVVVGPHPQPLRLEQFALPLEFCQAFLQLFLDRRDRLGHSLGTGDVVGGRKDP